MFIITEFTGNASAQNIFDTFLFSKLEYVLNSCLFYDAN
jgi:hypothetical protein